MEVWKILWMIALLFGFSGFSYISYRVIVRGLGETKSLLKGSGGETEKAGDEKKEPPPDLPL